MVLGCAVLLAFSGDGGLFYANIIGSHSLTVFVSASAQRGQATSRIRVISMRGNRAADGGIPIGRPLEMLLWFCLVFSSA